MKNVLLVAMILIGAYALYAGSRPAVTQPAAVAWTELPAAVRDRIAVYAAGDEIREIGAGLRGSTIFYRAVASAPDGATIVIKVDAGGKLIGLKYDDDAETDANSRENLAYPTR